MDRGKSDCYFVRLLYLDQDGMGTEYGKLLKGRVYPIFGSRNCTKISSHWSIE